MRASPVRLVPPGSIVGFLGDLAVPADFYWVAREPVPLAGMAYPGRVDWPALAAEGLGHVVCLTHDEPRYDPSPLTTTAVRLEDLFAGGAPSDPAAEHARVEAAADAVVERYAAGTGVVVHCMGGRGRAGTVLGVALVRMGHDPETVVDYLHRVHVGRGRKDGWPESPWQAATVRGAAGAP
jgi:rhodanese/phosphatase family protein